ncbi:MAG: TlpA family protein disulfide reductase [Dehalococcoidia bacterium]|nr:TlpA family protein disulfide reductase [Dehalococcoidia bacterium]
MATRTPALARRRLFEFLALGAAVAIAVTVGATLLLAGDDEATAPSSPKDVAEQMYRALERGDAVAFEATLSPAVRTDPEARATLPFGSSLGPGDTAAPVPIKALALKETNNQDGWATVRATGTLDQGGLVRGFDETVYLQDVGGRWLITTQAAFVRAFSTPSARADSRGLGPLDPQRPKIGEPAPDFALLDARDGTTVRHLSDYRGKVVVVNWYASWCGPCRAEIPEFQDAYAALPDDLVVLGVNYQESRERATGILDVFHAKYPAVLDATAAVAAHYRVGAGLPVTFVVDREGVLSAMKTGQVHADELVAYLAAAGLAYAPR